MKRIDIFLILFWLTFQTNAQISNFEACYALSGSANDPINNLNGTIGPGLIATTDRHNFPFGCYSFNGTLSSAITLPNSPMLKGQAMSVSAWVYPTVVNGSYIVFTKNNFNSYHEAYALSIAGNKFAANKVNSGGQYYQFSNNIVQINTWYHLVMCVDQNNLYLYVNGILQSSGPAPGLIEYQSGKNVMIGGSGESYFPGAFAGKIDNVKFYSKVLNASEVNQLYTVDAPCVCSGPIFASLKHNNVDYPSIPPSIAKYDKFEIDLDIRDCNWNNYLEPSDPSQIEVWTVMHSPTGKTYTVNGFFFQDYARSYGDADAVLSANYGGPAPCCPWQWKTWYRDYCYANPTAGTSISGFIWPYEILDQSNQARPHWKIRFTPNEVGNWTFEVFAREGGISGPCKSWGWGNASCANFFPLSFNCTNSNSKGFIRKANKRYLKYENGEPFFPIGTGMGGYTTVSYLNSYGSGFLSPEVCGTVEYEVFLNQLDLDKINYIRIFLNAGGINIFGYDYSMEVCYYKNIVWNDPTNNNAPTNTYGINLRDAWELDWIFDYCKQKGINIQLALFNSADFINCGGNYNLWKNSPFYNAGVNQPESQQGITNHNHLTGANGCSTPYEFFDINKPALLKLQKDMIKYVISRWGHATNLVSWEIMNEINLIYNQNVFTPGCSNPSPPTNLEDNMLNWVSTMKTWINTVDPYKHLVTCTPVNNISPTLMAIQDPNIDQPNSTLWTQNPKRRLANEIWKLMDYTDEHRYTDPFINAGNPASQQIFTYTKEFSSYSRPHFISEFTSLCPNGTEPGCSMWMKTQDPFGFHFHGVSWSSGFNGNLGVGNCWWHDNIVLLDKLDYNLKALHEYWKDVPLDQDDNMVYNRTAGGFSGPVAMSPFNYYMIRNRKEIYGWANHPAFTIERLKTNNPSYLTNLTNRPVPNGNMTLSFPNVENGQYTVKWYNTKTGAVISTQNANANAYNLVVNIPASIFSDVNNTFGDVAYAIKKDCHTSECGWNEIPLNILANNVVYDSKLATTNGHVFYVDASLNLFNMYMYGTWQFTPVNLAFTKVASGSSLRTDTNGNLYYIGQDNKVYKVWWNNGWFEQIISGSILANPYCGIAVDGTGVVYFGNTKIYQCVQSGPSWACSMVPGSPTIKSGSDLAVSEFGGKYDLFYVANDSKVHSFRKNGAVWSDMQVSNNWVYFDAAYTASAKGSKFEIDKLQKRVFYIGPGAKVFNAYSTSAPYTSWQDHALNLSAPPIINNTEYVFDGANHVFFYAPGGDVYNYYWDQSVPGWLVGPLNQCRISKGSQNAGLSYIDNHLYYVGINSFIRGAFWENNTCPSSRSANTVEENVDPSVSVNEQVNNFKLVIQPNPSSNETFIHIETEKAFSEPVISIVNILGESILKNKLEPINPGFFDYQLSLNELKPGIYFVNLIDKQKLVISKKLIIN